jgi:hypothetical protein
LRYTDKVTFIKQGDSHYDPDLGENVSTEPIEVNRWCHVVTPTMAKSALVFGNLQESDLIIHLKQPYKDTYDYCLVSDGKYFFVTQKTVGRRQIILVRGNDDANRN